MAASAQVLGPVGAFFRWWSGELAALLPGRLRQVGGRDEQVVLAARSGRISVFLETARGKNPLGRIDSRSREAAATLAEILRRGRVAQAIRRGKLGVCVRLPPDAALRKVMTLPAAAAGNLAEVVAFELDRHTPFRADQVYFACRLLRREPGERDLPVEVTLVPRPVVDEALGSAADLGLDPAGVDVEGDTPDAPPSDRLLIPHAATMATRARRIGLTGVLALAAAALAMVAVTIPLVTTHRAAALMSREVAVAARSVEAAAALRDEIRKLREEQNFLIARKSRTAPVSDLLLEVTRILSDDTWLTDLHVVGDEVRLLGFTASASGLVGLLEGSGAFRNTVFISPVTRDPRLGRERFGIGATLVQGPAR